MKVNNQSGLNDQFNQWLAVDETNGKIALMYYDTVGDSTRKSTNVYYQSSTDDGVTWSAPFKVTTLSTNETTTGSDSGNQYGDYNSLSGISGTFFPSWTDRRNGASEEIWTAAIADGTVATPDFSISASPSATSIAPGSAGNVTVSTTALNGFNNSISLSASGQPTGVTVGFSPNPIAAPGTGSSTMTITVAASTVPGTYTITVTGTGGTTTHPASVTLTVPSGSTSQLLGNPGFENGSASPAPWTATAGVIDNSAGEAAHSGSWKAWLDGYGTTHTDSVFQDVTIPASAASLPSRPPMNCTWAWRSPRVMTSLLLRTRRRARIPGDRNDSQSTCRAAPFPWGGRASMVRATSLYCCSAMMRGVFRPQRFSSSC